MKSFSQILFAISCGMLALALLSLLTIRLLDLRCPDRLGLCVAGSLIFGFVGMCLFRPVDTSTRPRRMRRAPSPFDRKPKPNHTPYNTHGVKADKPVWRNIPGHATLLLDTNVLMCPDEAIRSWFGYLLHNAAQRDWTVVIIGAVYEEVMHHLKHGQEQKARDARLARNRIELLTDELGERMQIVGLSAAAVTPTDAHYADPLLIEYMCAHKRTFLFSFDNDLKIRCKHLLRTTQPKNRVFSEEDFYA